MKHTVIYKYMEGEGEGMTVTREMTQEELGQLLLTEQVELVSVNAPKPAYRKKKERKMMKDEWKY